MLTIEDKLKVCDLVNSGRLLTSVAAEFNVAKSVIHDIVKNNCKAKLQTFLAILNSLLIQTARKRVQTLKQARVSDYLHTN